jgi:hypothetical protein
MSIGRLFQSSWPEISCEKNSKDFLMMNNIAWGCVTVTLTLHCPVLSKFLPADCMSLGLFNEEISTALVLPWFENYEFETV